MYIHWIYKLKYFDIQNKLLWFTDYQVHASSGTWLSPRTRHHAPKAAISQRVRTGSQSGKMSRCVHIPGICVVYNMYMTVICFVYTCTELIMLTGLFGNYPSSSILHWRAWRQLWRCWITIWSRQFVVCQCASPTVLPLYAAPHRSCGGPLQPFRRGHSDRPDFLQPLWGTSLEDCWNHGIERNSQGTRALTCSHSLRREGRASSAEFHSFYFLDGNATSTIPHKHSSRQKDAFECGCADGVGPTLWRGSHVYEINTWLWNFRRPQPRVGGLSVAKTEKLRQKSRSEASKRGWATKRACKWPSHGICIVCIWNIPEI